MIRLSQLDMVLQEIMQWYTCEELVHRTQAFTAR